jgi:hypothetical protein
MWCHLVDHDDVLLGRLQDLRPEGSSSRGGGGISAPCSHADSALAALVASSAPTARGISGAAAAGQWSWNCVRCGSLCWSVGARLRMPSANRGAADTARWRHGIAGRAAGRTGSRDRSDHRRSAEQCDAMPGSSSEAPRWKLAKETAQESARAGCLYVRNRAARRLYRWPLLQAALCPRGEATGAPASDGRSGRLLCETQHRRTG